MHLFVLGTYWNFRDFPQYPMKNKVWPLVGMSLLIYREKYLRLIQRRKTIKQDKWVSLLSISSVTIRFIFSRSPLRISAEVQLIEHPEVSCGFSFSLRRNYPPRGHERPFEISSVQRLVLPSHLTLSNLRSWNSVVNIMARRLHGEVMIELHAFLKSETFQVGAGCSPFD
jgi:hypothetical protein